MNVPIIICFIIAKPKRINQKRYRVSSTGRQIQYLKSSLEEQFNQI